MRSSIRGQQGRSYEVVPVRGRRDAADGLEHWGAGRVRLRPLGGDLGHRRGRASADASAARAGRSGAASAGSASDPRRTTGAVSAFQQPDAASDRPDEYWRQPGGSCSSNTFGTAPLTIGAAHVALREKESAIAPESDRALTFSGRPTITIPSGAVVYSDPVDLDVPALADLAVDLYLPGNTNTTSPVTMHNGARQTSYVSQTGNHVGIPALPVVATTQSWFLLTRRRGDRAGTGWRDRRLRRFDHRWSRFDGGHEQALARSPRRALDGAAGQREDGRAQRGIGGNRVLSEGKFNAGINALARFERDALGQSGVTHVIVLEGINDISNAQAEPDADRRGHHRHPQTDDRARPHQGHQDLSVRH